VLGGRIDGLHQIQPFAAFLPSENNTAAFVIDPDKKQVWEAALDSLPTKIFEQLQSTNQEFIQRNNQLYIIGGYGYSPTEEDHITYPYLTAVDVNGLSNAIISGNKIDSYFRQIHNEKMAVTGGNVGCLNDVFYLAGGHYFEGRYNPGGPDFGPGFIQEYTNAIRKFKLKDDGVNLVAIDFSEMVDTNNLHRRDLNMAPQIFPNGDLGYTMFSGVFQKHDDVPYLNTVDISPITYKVNNNFNQYLSHYHSAHIPIYDGKNKVMHTVFFGGISQFVLDSIGHLVEDASVPFVKTISQISRFDDGEMQEVKLNIEMPAFLGSGAEFISHSEASFLPSGILKLDDLPKQRTLVGYIFGGIKSSKENIFFNNDGTQSMANNTIFKVYINQIAKSNNLKVKGSYVFQIKIYNNPSDNQIVVDFFNPSKGIVTIALSNSNGEIIKEIYQGNIDQGNQKKLFEFPNVKAGAYFISIENDTIKNIKTIYVE
jgi:hypothetical protein